MADPAEETIFAQEPTQTPTPTEEPKPQEPTSTNDAFADLLASIKAEDGRQKYSDVESALKSLPHANEHISKLEQEMAQLREELGKRATAEEIMSKLEAQAQPSTETPSEPAVDLSQIEQLVDKRLNSVEQKRIATNNISSVTSKMSEVYGDKAEQVFYSAGQEAGLSPAELNALAAKSPVAALRLVGVDTKTPASIPAKTTSTVNTEALSTNGQDVPSAKVPKGASTNDMVNAWRNAGKKL